MEHRVTFLPSQKTVLAVEGETLIEAALRADVDINANCGGQGSCGKCKVKIEAGGVKKQETEQLTPEDLQLGYVLACTSRVNGEVTVAIPETSDRRNISVVEGAEALSETIPAGELSPMVQVIGIKLSEPSLDDPVGDYERVKRFLSSQGFPTDHMIVGVQQLNELSGALRDDSWQADIAMVERGCSRELVRSRSGSGSVKPYGIAVDIGTTTIVVHLADLSSGKLLGSASNLNRQVSCGADVINRILFAAKPGGMKRLQRYVVQTINDLIQKLADVNGLNTADIFAASLAGNTIMTHLLLGLDPQHIRAEPYVPVVTEFPTFVADGIGLSIHPRAGVFVAPCNAAYVGGDITAGVLYAGFHKQPGLTLFVDVGTNGEMVLGGQDFLMTAACSAGPAFEGGGIRHGMRATPGAIDTIQIDPDTYLPSYTTIEGQKPIGLCGSGMIDLLSTLFLSGAIDGRGKFVDGLPETLVRVGIYGREYVVAPAMQNGLGQDITFSEADIDTLVRSKGAVYGGIQSLLKQAGLSLDSIQRVLIAGGFGRNLNLQHTIDIGMFPDLSLDRYSYIGNSSVAGALMTLLSRKHREEIVSIARNMTYIDFSSSALFFDEYQSALFLPHTENQTFPSVMKRQKHKGATQ